MTLSELETFVKNITGEDATVGTSSLFTTAQLDAVINVAQRHIWEEAVKTNQSLFTERSADKTFVAATGYYDYSGTALNTNGVYLITGLEYKYQSVYYSVRPVDKQDRFLYEDSSGLSLTSDIPACHYFEGEKLYLAPAPLVSQTIRFSFIPNLADLSSGSTVAMGGKLTSYHHLIGYEAAAILLAKDESKFAQEWRDRKDEGLKQMRMHLSRRTSQEPRRVRFEPY